MAAAVGPQAQVLLEQVTPQDAVALVDHQLDRVLGTAPRDAGSPAGGRRTPA